MFDLLVSLLKLMLIATAPSFDAAATAADIRRSGRRAYTVKRNLAVASGVRSMLEQCAGELGEVTCVVNSASMFEPDTALDFEPARLARHIQVNVAAPVLLAQQLGHPARHQGGDARMRAHRRRLPEPELGEPAIPRQRFRQHDIGIVSRAGEQRHDGDLVRR